MVAFMKRVVKSSEPTSPHINNAVTLGQFVRASRTTSGMTIDQAAMCIGVAKQTLADLENGKPTTSIGIILRILAGLGLNLFVADKSDTMALSEFIRQRPILTGRKK
jgi:DNA-binding XRE family transcriptional regulator